MNTISPGIESSIGVERQAMDKWRLSPAAWSAIAFAALAAVVTLWRVLICFGSVLACTR